MSTKAKRECLSFQCTNRLGKTNCLSPYIVSRLSKMCIVSKKKKRKKKKRATNAFIEDFLLKTMPGNNEELLIKMFYEETYSELINNDEDRRASLSEGALNAFPTFGSKTRDWRILAGGILKCFIWPRKYGTEHSQVRHSWHCVNR